MRLNALKRAFYAGLHVILTANKKTAFYAVFVILLILSKRF